MRFARSFAVFLLVLLGITAFAGSIPMILQPGGNSTLSLSTLQYSPFRSYLIPGILLFTANGVLAFAVLWLVARRKAHYGLWVGLQGCVLLVWLVAECVLLRTVIWLHYLYGSIAIALIVCGIILRRDKLETTRADMRRERRSA